jgi:hypothetical protein
MSSGRGHLRAGSSKRFLEKGNVRLRGIGNVVNAGARARGMGMYAGAASGKGKGQAAGKGGGGGLDGSLTKSASRESRRGLSASNWVETEM